MLPATRPTWSEARRSGRGHAFCTSEKSTAVVHVQSEVMLDRLERESQVYATLDTTEKRLSVTPHRLLLACWHAHGVACSPVLISDIVHASVVIGHQAPQCAQYENYKAETSGGVLVS